MGINMVKTLAAAGLVCLSAACASGGEDLTSDSAGGAERADATSQVDTASTPAPPPTTEAILIDAGSGTIEVAGQVQGTSVMATSSEFQIFCGELYEGFEAGSVIAHHIRWRGRGGDELESLGLVATDGLATQGMATIRLGVLEDSRFTGDLDQPLLDYPSLNDIVRREELDYSAVYFVAEPDGNLDLQAVHLDLDLVDPGDPDTTLRVTADFGCEEDAVRRAEAGPSPGA